MKKIKIGRIAGAQGLRGEVKLYHDSGDESALRRLSSLYLLQNGKETAYPVLGFRMNKRTPIFDLKGVDDRDAAEALIGAEVWSILEEARPDEGEGWLVSDLVGLPVLLESNNARIGILKNIIGNPAHDLLEIETEGGIKLLPFIDTFVRSVDSEKRQILIVPPEGWTE